MSQLDRIRVASPCHESWADMSGDERARHCQRCDQTVFDLSGMSRAEAEDLVRRAQGGEEVCVRFYRRKDGTVLTRDCPTQVREGRSRWAGVKTAAAGLMALASGLAAGCTDGGQATVVTRQPVKPPITSVDPGNDPAPCCDGTGPCCEGKVETPEVPEPLPEPMMGAMAPPPEWERPPQPPKVEPEREAPQDECQPRTETPRRVMGKMKAPQRKLPVAEEAK